MDHKFEDAQQMHRLHPKTFDVPCQADLDAIGDGCYVKVCHNKERFWVKIAIVNGDRIIGEVCNMLINSHPFGYGDMVEFQKKHIYCVQRY